MEFRNEPTPQKVYPNSQYQNQTPQYQYLTPVNLVLVLMNVAVYFVLEIMGDTTDGSFMLQHGAMITDAIYYPSQWYRLLTCVFLHFGFTHLINNMVMLFCLGSYMEKALGSIKYAVFYLVSGIGSSILAALWNVRCGKTVVSAGASGAIFGIIGALLFLVLLHHGRFKNLTLRRFLLMLALSLYYGFSTTGVDNAAHLCGLLVGFVLAILLYREKKEKP